MKSQISQADLEQAFERIAQAVDRVGKAHEADFLAKLCLALATQLPSIDPIAAAIRAAEEAVMKP
jgi:hypothetical protein